MKNCLVIACVVLAATVLPAKAKELSFEGSAEVLAKGEVIWSKVEAPAFLLRHKGGVFWCEVRKSVSRGATEPNLDEVQNIPRANIEMLLDDPLINARPFDKLYGAGAAAKILGDGFGQDYVDISCWDARR